MKSKIYFVFILSLLAINNGFSQEKKSETKENNEVDNIIMTWNKSTPEQEMKDDIKALAEHGVTITYSNVKRNSKNEITAIKVAYADKSGSKGAMELDNQKPINTIKFYKQNDEVGFGEPTDSDFIVGNFPNGQNFMKQFNLGNGGDQSQSFNFNFPDDGVFGRSGSSKIIIQNDGKKPLVIEDGKVTEGGDDYTPEEIEKIKENNKVDSFGGFGSSNFDFNSDPQNESTKEELLKAKEEMLKAKEEMKKTTEELKKAKSSLKTQKA